MFSFALSSEQQAVVDMAREFARKEMLPKAAHHDQSMEYPWEVIKKAHANGLLNLGLKEEHGGLGVGSLVQAMIVEELAYGCSAMATAITANDLALGPLLVAANKAQIEVYKLDGAQEFKLRVKRERGGNPVGVDFACVIALGLQENLVGVAVGKLHHLVLKRGTIAWADRLDVARVER
jgi:hypothetical protein